MVQCRFRLVDRPPVGLSVIPSPREVGGMECCDMVAVGGINQAGRSRHPEGGDHDPSDPHPPLLRGGRLLMPPPGARM